MSRVQIPVCPLTEEIKQDIEEALKENGPMTFKELRQELDHAPNNILFDVVNGQKFYADDEGRWHLGVE